MSAITIQDGKIVLRDGRVGTETACCCEVCPCDGPGTPPAIASVEGRGLVWLTFSSCIGTGAAGTVTAPEAATPCDYEGMAGPLQGVTLTNGGSGYARLGRVEPTLTPSVADGLGATLSVSLDEGEDVVGTCVDTLPIWSVSGITVTSGGSGYAEGSAVTFSAAGGDTTVSAAAGTARVVHEEPANAVLTINSLGGSGAVLTPVWELLSSGDWPAEHKKTYRLVSVTVVNGGSGYSDYEDIQISFASVDDGTVLEEAYIDADIVAAGGVIQQIYIADGGDINTPAPAGRYVGSRTDELHSAAITDGGAYYREDASEPPFVASVTVTVNQEGVSNGSGAVVTATVEDDTASANFGKVVALTLEEAGAGYLDVSPACNLPDRLYIDWYGNTYEVPMYLGFFEGSYLIIPIGRTIQEAGGVTGLCVGGNAMPPVLGNTFSASGAEALSGFVVSSNDYVLRCRCGGKLDILLRVFAECFEYVNSPTQLEPDRIDSTSLARKHYSWCLRFDVDEDGCPVGDAEVVSFTEQWISPNQPADTPPPEGCDTTCFTRLDPVVSLMPP